MKSARYGAIGIDYARFRTEDPRMAALVHAALGDAKPSDVMAAQRVPHRRPAPRGSAGALPLRDRSVEGAMAMARP